MIDTSQTPAMEVHTATTLLPIIQAHVAPRTIIYSDEWSAYHRVSSLPSVSSHSTVNHSVHFVDPGTGLHTQHIESYWERAKHKLKHMKGCNLHEVPSYLDKFMWREHYGIWKGGFHQHLPAHSSRVSSFSVTFESHLLMLSSSSEDAWLCPLSSARTF